MIAIALIICLFGNYMCCIYTELPLRFVSAHATSRITAVNI